MQYNILIEIRKIHSATTKQTIQYAKRKGELIFGSLFFFTQCEERLVLQKGVTMKPTCQKCGTDQNMTEHHLIPVYFKGRKYNQNKIFLCRKCHDKLETIILGVECFVGHLPYGKRFRLHNESYYRIAESFTGKEVLCGT